MGFVLELLVHVGDLAVHGSVDVSGDLHALHHCCRVVGLELLVHAGELEVGDLTELLLGVVGDAHSGYLLLRQVLDPLVTFGEVLG